MVFFNESVEDVSSPRSLLMHDDGLAFEVPRLDEFLLRKRVIRWNDEDQTVLQDIPNNQFLVIRGVGGEPQVIFQSGRIFNDLRIWKDMDRDLNLTRVFLPKPLDDEREIVGPKALAGVNSDPSAFPLLKITENFFSLISRLKDLARKIVESFASISEYHLLAKPVQKLDAVSRLELLNLLSDRRLGDIEGLGGSAHAPAFDGIVKGLELVKIHDR